MGFDDGLHFVRIVLDKQNRRGHECIELRVAYRLAGDKVPALALAEVTLVDEFVAHLDEGGFNVAADGLD